MSFVKFHSFDDWLVEIVLQTREKIGEVVEIMKQTWLKQIASEAHCCKLAPYCAAFTVLDDKLLSLFFLSRN